MKRPNILFYFVDQQRWDTCGCYGQRRDVTPNLDAFAAQGVLFENAFTCQPVCGPARAALQTGMWPTQLGCYRNGLGLPENAVTIAGLLNEAGYQTAYCGKWHLATIDGKCDYVTKPVPPERRGGYKDFWIASDVLEFTSHGYGGHMFRADGSMYSFDGYRADAVTDAALEFLEGARDRDKPFFLFVSHIEPHHQNDHNRYEGPIGSKEEWADYDVPGDLAGTQGDWRENYPDYLGAIHALDRNFGRMLASLEKQGIADNTLVVYASDHGSHFRTRNAEYKRSCHDGCSHIPLVLRGPGFTGGTRVEKIVSLLALPRTLLAEAGVEAPDAMACHSLQETLKNPDSSAGCAYIQISESHVGRAVRTKRYLYGVGAPGTDGWKDADAEDYMECFLYDVQNDPSQRHNLVCDPSYENVREALRCMLLDRMRAADERPARIRPMTESPEDEAYLRAISHTK